MSPRPLFDERDMETFRLAVETWGVDAQADMAVEELAELTVELQHLKRDRTTWDEVQRELADIRIMYEQLRWYFGAEFVDERVQEKMDRLRERLEEAGVEIELEPASDGPIDELIGEARGTLASLWGEAEELRERDDFDDDPHLVDVAQGLEYAAEDLNKALRQVDERQFGDEVAADGGRR